MYLYSARAPGCFLRESTDSARAIPFPTLISRWGREWLSTEIILKRLSAAKEQSTAGKDIQVNNSSKMSNKLFPLMSSKGSVILALPLTKGPGFGKLERSRHQHQVGVGGSKKSQVDNARIVMFQRDCSNSTAETSPASAQLGRPRRKTCEYGSEA